MGTAFAALEGIGAGQVHAGLTRHCDTPTHLTPDRTTSIPLDRRVDDSRMGAQHSDQIRQNLGAYAAHGLARGGNCAAERAPTHGTEHRVGRYV